jgi:serine/threonine protein kinase
MQVALKELKVLQSDDTQNDHGTAGADAEWEREARALRAIKKLDHPHIVKCIAAVRRGDSRYFMFHWAEGNNLRDFWVNSPRREPSHEIILQTITQLLGIADALFNLHNYRDGRRRSLPGNSLSINAPSIHVGQIDALSVPRMDGDESDDEDFSTSNTVNIRHGDLKPENILRFTTDGNTGLGTLKIADMGLAKQHVLATSDRNAKRQITSTRYGTQPYEAPETTTAMYGRSRLYDIWSMGCITLEFIIWILYGVERLSEFYDQIAGGPQLPYQYYEIPDAKEPTHAQVHRVVLKWMDHIENKDPECSQDSAIRDLLGLIREKLLVVRLPASSVSSRSAGRPLAPPAFGEASRFRATAEEFRNALKDILAKARHRSYLYTGKDRSRARPPEIMLSPTGQRSDSERVHSNHSPILSGVRGRPIRADYSLPPLKDWHFPVDNRFADAVALRVGNATFWPRSRETPKLCERCEKLDFWTGGFFIDDDVFSLLMSAQTCDFCKMLRDSRRDDDSAATAQVRFERKESNILLAGDPFPVLSILRAPDAKRTTSHFQMGYPELPKPNTKPFFDILNLWLEDCNTNHNDPKIRDRDCRGVTKTRLPTRLIDVGTLEGPILRLVETQEENISKNEEYIALSHPWGDTRNYTPFSTLRKDPEGTHHESDFFKRAIPYDELPATFRDAVICTRQLRIQYLWIDS